MFFNEKRYNLGEVGRYKVNTRLGIDVDINTRTLTVTDFVYIFKTLINIYHDEDEIDDIDNLANRRVRTVGELLQEQYNSGLAMVSRIIQERLAISNSERSLSTIGHSNALISVVQSFFLTAASQFMEQTILGSFAQESFLGSGPGVLLVI
jgi:DNA-directed RNA polymerase subunit beta